MVKMNWKKQKELLNEIDRIFCFSRKYGLTNSELLEYILRRHFQLRIYKTKEMGLLRLKDIK